MIGEMGYRKSRGQKRGGDRKTAHAQLDTRQREARSSTCDCCEPVATVDEPDTTFTDAATYCRQYQVDPKIRVSSSIAARCPALARVA
jgi:hypothetical protein